MNAAVVAATTGTSRRIASLSIDSQLRLGSEAVEPSVSGHFLRGDRTRPTPRAAGALLARCGAVPECPSVGCAPARSTGHCVVKIAPRRQPPFLDSLALGLLFRLDALVLGYARRIFPCVNEKTLPELRARARQP
jgi:hypothetical protein